MGNIGIYLLVLICLGLVTGCGVSQIRCEVITDEELLKEVLSEVLQGVPEEKVGSAIHNDLREVSE